MRGETINAPAGLFIGDLMDKRWSGDSQKRCIVCGQVTGDAREWIILDSEDRIQDSGPRYPIGSTCAAKVRALAAQPAARGGKEHDKPEAAGDNGSRISPVLATKLPPAPPPPDDAAVPAFVDRMSREADADVLERAAEILDLHSYGGSAHNARNVAASYRQHPAPEPAPDVFTSFGAFSFESTSTSIAEDARDWFGPLVDALERIKWRNTDASGAAHIAGQALAQLRARAKEGK